jgi:tetratricopeptide (TPR) repeat protein
MGEITTLRQLYEARKLDEAWVEYQRLRGAGPADAASHLLGGLVARLRGDLPGARAALERGLTLHPQGSALGQLRMTLGTVLRETGEILASIEILETFLADMHLYPALRAVAVGAGLHNLALAYRCARRFEDARQSYETAILEFRTEGLRNYLMQSLRNLAWLCCLMGEVRRAEECLSDVDVLCETREDRWHWQVGMAFLSLVGGDPEDALRRCDAIVQDGVSVPPGIMSHTYWVAGKVSAQLGLLEEADSLADQAVSWSLRVKDDIRQMQDASDLKREIHQLRIHEQSAGA